MPPLRSMILSISSVFLSTEQYDVQVPIKYTANSLFYGFLPFILLLLYKPTRTSHMNLIVRDYISLPAQPLELPSMISWRYVIAEPPIV